MKIGRGIQGRQLICVARKIGYLRSMPDGREVYVAKSPDRAKCFVDKEAEWKE